MCIKLLERICLEGKQKWLMTDGVKIGLMGIGFEASVCFLNEK